MARCIRVSLAAHTRRCLFGLVAVPPIALLRFAVGWMAACTAGAAAGVLEAEGGGAGDAVGNVGV